LNYLDLFSGIGGFAPGAYPAGLRFEGHYSPETDDYAVSVYKKRFPDAVAPGDLKVIGLAGERSGLWFEYAGLIKETGPEVCPIENVPRLARQVLYEILASLARAGIMGAG